jgi:hypothetical protein
MLRAARPRLRLEPCEDRALSAAVTPTAPPDAHPTVQSPATDHDTEADEAAEYANPKGTGSEDRSPGGRMTDPKPATAREYGPTYYPAAPPLPLGPTVAAAPAAVIAPPPIRPAPVLVGMGEPPAAPVVVPPVSATPLPEGAPVVPLDDGDPPTGPPVGAGDQPAGTEPESPPAGPAPFDWPSIDNLDLRLDAAAWANAAGRLLDRLDAALDPLDGESPWARLGYWALTVGAVGVTVELTRHGLRARAPEPEDGPTVRGPR